jgi:hypothetical protein
VIPNRGGRRNRPVQSECPCALRSDRPKLLRCRRTEASNAATPWHRMRGGVRAQSYRVLLRDVCEFVDATTSLLTDVSTTSAR